jgi:hypothetical protein
VHDLLPAGRLAAWGSAALAGAVSPDEAADAVTGPHDPGHRVSGLPGEDAPVTLPYALVRLRALGATGLRLVLPRPGDVSGLPGPADLNAAALAAGAAVVAAGGCHLALVPGGRATWAAHAASPDGRSRPTVREAERALGAAVRDAAAELARLDVARWDPAAAEVVHGRPASGRTPLPASADPAAHALLTQAMRIARLVEVATASDGAAVTGSESTARALVLRDLGDAARHAVEAACSLGPGDR